MPTIWYEARVSRTEDMTPQVRRFFLQLPEGKPPAFEAGQFITLDLPIGEKRLQRWRSYSIASGPADGPDMELCIVRLDGGEGTRYLFEEVREGSILRFKGPDGAFTLPLNLEDRDLVMVCTGTGVAPFRSMLRDLFARRQSYRRLHLIFGARTEADILYRHEFEGYAAAHPNFRYDVALSRQPDWPGYRGHLHQVYLEHYVEKRPDVLFMLCGWSRMIDDAVANLVARLGYAPHQVKYELYG